MSQPGTRWTIHADLGALTALKNNRDRIYLDSAATVPVMSGAQQRAIARSEKQSPGARPMITAGDLAAAMQAAGLAFRADEYVCDIAPWVKPGPAFSQPWGEESGNA